jgi:hypothetical protein
MGPARIRADAPSELTSGKLRRLGEGIGKVVYASTHWVVKRERSPAEVIALIWLWKLLRRLEGWVPGASRLLERPSKQIRVLRVCIQATMLIVPRGVWLTRHVKDVWKLYRTRDWRGERLAEQHLASTDLVPRRIEFPPTKVRVGGWPYWLTISEATERVECTLYQKLASLAKQGQLAELEVWLDRFLVLRQAGWQRGLFSLDAHLKNFGVTGDRIVLLDPGGLTDKWEDVEQRLAFEEVISQPHIQLGLGPVLGAQPDIAARFDAKWKEIVNREVVRTHWPQSIAS